MTKNTNSGSLSFLGFLSMDGLMGLAKKDIQHAFTSFSLAVAYILDQKFKISG